MSDPWNVWGLSRAQALLVGALLAAYFVALILINCVWIPYPVDNDLDEVGWLVKHLSLSRPESFANQVYPPGLPLVLAALRPIFGSILRAVFVWQAIAVTVTLFLVFRTALALFKSWDSAILALVCAICASSIVATSEFADGTSTALLLGGVCVLVLRRGDGYGFFFLGMGAGLAYLFRLHNLVFIALVPATTLVVGYGVRNTARRSLAFVAGFAATAWPLWLMNLLAYGHLRAETSQYNIAVFMADGVDWENYLETYNRWPLVRILRERPRELARHVFDVARQVLGMKLSLAGLVMGSVAAVGEKDRERRRLILFIGALALAYLGAVIIPTHFTDRAYFPVAMLAALLVGGGLARLRASLASSRWAGAIALGSALILGYPADLRQHLRLKRGAFVHNRQVVDALVRHGMTSSAEVFCNDWDLFNLADPSFDTFYNYGGWILLDSRYAAERPPPRATTLKEWQDFFEQHHIHFAVLKRVPKTEEIFAHTPASWRRIFEDKWVTVFALEPQ
jgi:hypothetical protein